MTGMTTVNFWRVVNPDKLGRLIFWKTFHIQHGVKDKWQKINLAKK